jgi:hypothetical protein
VRAAFADGHLAAPTQAPTQAPTPAPVPAPVPTPVPAPVPAPVLGRRSEPRRARARHAATPADGPLAGSVLSAQTWRDAFAVAMGRS